MNIYDIAGRAGVSIATVSRVMNGSGAVSPRTAQKVLKAIEESGYRPNVFAQGLNTNSIRIIGLLTTNISDAYYASAIHTIEQCAKQRGYDLLLSCASSSIEDKKKHINLLLKKRVDGIILIGSVFHETSDNAHILEAAVAAPVVLLNGHVEGAGIYSVACDDEAGARTAAEYLAARGRKRIAYVYDADTYSGRRKLEGYRQAVGQAGLEPVEIKTAPGLDGGCHAAGELIARGAVDGVVCAEDELAAGVLKRLKQRGVSVPGSVAVIGYNDSLTARCTDPELASVDSKVRQLSACALETVVKAIETGEAAGGTVVMPKLVVRGSADI